LFEKNSAEYFEYDLNVPLLEALDFSVPPQETYIKRPLLNGFTIYDDDFGADVINTSASGEGVLDFYSGDVPLAGTRCIYWTGVGQYDAMSFDFKRHLDLSLLMENDHVLRFSVRGNNPAARFDVRFIDSRRNEADLPWRMGKTMEGIPADEQWHTLEIPLKDLEEKGAWEDVYYPPDGKKFDWTSVDRFEIIPEHQSLNGIEFSFDEIFIVGDQVTAPVTAVEKMPDQLGLTVHPNPITKNTIINYTITDRRVVNVYVIDVHGRIVKSFPTSSINPGSQRILWDGTNNSGQRLAHGLYFIWVKAGQSQHVQKVILIE
jgi:endoglucanase